MSQKKDTGITENGRKAFDCTNTTCPRYGGKKVWSIDLGADEVITQIGIHRRTYGNVNNDVLLNIHVDNA